jgi:sugar lactone lactonase YvrE
VGRAELVHAFPEQMPTGVAVSDDGRVFVSYPRWGDGGSFTVAELRDGVEVPYPDAAVNALDLERPGECLVSVHRLEIDPVGRLWLVDTGSVELGETLPGAPKLVCVDIARDEIVATILLPRELAPPGSYLNDVRFDLRRGDAGIAFISDSGYYGFIVVDLASGRSWRKLTGHPTVRPVDDFVAFVEGRPLEMPFKPGLDGIAPSQDGRRLLYTAICSRRLFSVSLTALADEAAADEDVAATIRDAGEKGASDAITSDTQGRVYTSNYEHGSIVCAGPGGPWETIVHQPGMLFVDSLCLAADGHLYFTVNQLHRHPYFQDGEDLRERPYALLRTPVDAAPVRLAP